MTGNNPIDREGNNPLMAEYALSRIKAQVKEFVAATPAASGDERRRIVEDAIREALNK